MIMIVSWAIENNLVNFARLSITKLICGFFLVRSMIVIVSWAIENNLVYLRTILVRSIIVIVSWAIKNNLVY